MKIVDRAISRLFRRTESVDSGRLVGTVNELPRKLAEIPSGSRILDAGAGERRYFKHCSHLQYISQDFGQYDVTSNARALQTGSWDQSKIDMLCDITAIPQADASFDAVLCTEVFEHLPDPLAALRELSRLLRPGGCLLLTAPFCSLTHFAPYHFASGFNRYWYEHNLPAAGVNTCEVTPNGNFFEFVAQELRRVDYCGKQYAEAGLWAEEKAALATVLSGLERMSTQERGQRSCCVLDITCMVCDCSGMRSEMTHLHFVDHSFQRRAKH